AAGAFGIAREKFAKPTPAGKAPGWRSCNCSKAGSTSSWQFGMPSAPSENGSGLPFHDVLLKPNANSAQVKFVTLLTETEPCHGSPRAHSPENNVAVIGK